MRAYSNVWNMYNYGRSVSNYLQAIMEEADMRFGEAKKSGYEFERDIVRGSINQRSGKVVAEKVIRYFEDKTKARVSVF